MSANLLSEVALILPGHPFRGAIRSYPDGDTRVVQMGDLTESGGIDWEGVVATKLKAGRRRPDWIRPDDILFVARGNRFFAVHLAEVPYQALPATQFIHIRLSPQSQGQVLPGFLAWQINRTPAQAFLASAATGTHIPVITKSALANLPIALPGLADQAHIVTLEQQIREETRCYEALIRNRRELMDALAYELHDSQRKQLP